MLVQMQVHSRLLIFGRVLTISGWPTNRPIYSPPKNRPELASTGTNRPLRTRIWILMNIPVVLSGLGVILRGC